jgi:hypothetical protein
MKENLFCLFVSHNGGKPPPLYPAREKTSSVVFHNRGKPPPLQFTMQELLLRCISQQQNIKKINNYANMNFSAK